MNKGSKFAGILSAAKGRGAEPSQTQEEARADVASTSETSIKRVEVSSREHLALLAGEDARRAVAGAAFAMFATSPIFGVGFGFFHFISPLYSGAGAAYGTYSHNELLSIMAEQGLVGLVLVASIVILLVVTLIRSGNRLRWAALAMGAAYLVVSFFINSATSFQGSCLVWMVMAAALTPIHNNRISEV